MTLLNFIDNSETIIQLSLIEGGGFYVGDLNGYRIICAPIEGQTTAMWKTSLTSTVGADSLTDGYQNTTDMTASGASDHPAANFCRNLIIGGFTDWYLPSKNELNLLYQNKSALEAAGAGAFSSRDYYWSSSEYSTKHAWFQYFYNGTQTNFYKDHADYVRAIRRVPIV